MCIFVQFSFLCAPELLMQDILKCNFYEYIVNTNNITNKLIKIQGHLATTNST